MNRPAKRNWHASIWAVIVIVIFALFLGFGIRNNAITASRTIELGAALPSLKIPNNWITGTPAGVLFYALNPRSPSIFNAEVSVTTLPIAIGQDIAAARTSLGLQRTQTLFRYRELSAMPVTVKGQDGILVTYAYIADPSREQGSIAPPVVVQAQDLLFPSGENQALVVTFAADASTWDAEEASIQLIQDSLGMKNQENILATGEFEEGGE